MAIKVTEQAIQEVKKAMEGNHLSENDYVLRVYHDYLGFEKKEETDPLNDIAYNFFGIEARIKRCDDNSLDGTIIDFHNSEDENCKGFVFNNPNIKSCCGGCCGKS